MNKNQNFAYISILISFALIAGIFLGKQLAQNNTANQTIFSMPIGNKLDVVLDLIETDYVDTVSKSDLIESTIPKILEELDPHSIYIPAEDFNRMNEPLEGNFEGIGVQFNIQNDTIMVVSVISGGPSGKIGLLAGDRIVMVDDSLVAGIGITNELVMKKLKGKGGTKVKVGVARRGIPKLIDFEIIRDKIPLYSVDVSYMIRPEIGYIKISRFGRTTYDEFVDAVEKLKTEGMNKIIVDLRGNSGGYLNAATDIIDEFLEQNQLIVYTQGKTRPRQSYYATSADMCTDLEVAVLIDSWSASASEILAGAIQDNDRGTILGQRSFGKGLVQEQTMFKDGSAMRLTTARYYTPTGRCIQKSYAKGTENYYEELHSRFMHGELEQEDSIHFSDSLKYTTPGGKIVYGGGGIMPDIFVPSDTTGFTPYFTKLVHKGLIYRFALEYTDNNRKYMADLTEPTQISNYLDQKNILDIFIQFAKQNGVEPNEKDISESHELLLTQIKAYIARNLIDNDGFYPIISRIDEVLQKSIEVLSEKE